MSCEKCWGDAYRRSMANGRSQADNYRDLLEERKDNPCGPEWETEAVQERERLAEARTRLAQKEQR